MNKNILIIEDDADNAFIMRFIIKQLGYHVSHSPEILPCTAILPLSPDLVILDHWVGNQLGGNLCLELKSRPETRHIPVIMVSAIIDLEQVAKRSRADGYLEKPFEVNKLSSLVKQFVAT